MKKGFTLVELSIVLVVIGLLIGGILAAQSMIINSKSKTMMADLRQIDVAITNFKTKYNSLPGDSARFNPTGAGNGDGFVTDASNYPLVTNANQQMWTGEIANFWITLEQSGFNMDGTSFITAIPNDPVKVYGFDIMRFAAKKGSPSNFPPARSLGKNAGYFLWPQCTSGNCASTYNYTYTIGVIGTFTSPNGRLLTLHNLPAGYARIIDTKYDDGVAGTGKLQSTDFDGCLTAGQYRSTTSLGGTNQSGCYMLIPAEF